MYVCLCNGITDSQIEEAICDGACSIKCLRQCLGVATQCGRCAKHAKQMLREHQEEITFSGNEAIAYAG